MFESKELNEILARELAIGNEIVEDSAWPPKCRRLIILKRHFNCSYPSKGVLKYSKIAGSHYWYAEYTRIDGRECLACQ